MNRREFLRKLGMGAGAAAIVAVTPKPVFEWAAKQHAKRAGVTLDFGHKTIHIEPGSEGVTMQAVYSHLVEEWNTDRGRIHG